MAFTLKMYLLKIMSEAICYFLVLRCLHIFCRFVQAVLYQKLQCAAENKRQTILSDLKFTWMHGILLFSAVSALQKTYNPIYTFQIIFHHVFWKRQSKKRAFSEIITISYCQSPMCLLTVENRGVHLGSELGLQLRSHVLKNRRLANTLLGESTFPESPASGSSFPIYKMQPCGDGGDSLGFQIEVSESLWFLN